MKKLWEVDHPYYMTEGCYYDRACHTVYDSWDDFLEEWNTADGDYNWIIRWDWEIPDPENYDEEYPNPYEKGEELFKIQFFMQRKAYPISCFIKVTRDQEPKIKEYLQESWEYMKKMWEPYSDA